MQASPSEKALTENFDDSVSRLDAILYENKTNSYVRFCESHLLSGTKKRNLVGALCKVLDDWSRFASRGASQIKKKNVGNY